MSDMAAMHVAHALFSALDAAHSASGSDGKIAPLVHARVGGHQLFLGWDGTVKLLGFGLSVLYRLSTALDAAGDEWTYAAPEVKSGGAFTVRANLYSAALLSWSLLTGKRPPDDGAPAPLSELRPDLPSSVVQLIDLALHPKLLQRRVSAKQIALALTPHVADGADQLKWFLEPLRAIADFDDTLLLRASLPPKSKLSHVPLASLPPMISLVPDSIAFMDAVVEEDDDDDDRALTIPAPPKR
jgi:hypothetical protein